MCWIYQCLISQYLRSLSFCQVLLRCLVKRGLGKSWLCRGPIYLGPALVSFLLFLLLSLCNNLSSTCLSTGLLTCPYSSFALLSCLSSLCLLFNILLLPCFRPPLLPLVLSPVNGPRPMTSSTSYGLSCHGFVCEPSCPTSTLHSYSPRPLLNPFVTGGLEGSRQDAS